MTDMDYRVSFQKALLDNSALIEKNIALLEETNKNTLAFNVEMAEWRTVIGADDKSGMRKFVCQHEIDIRGEGRNPGLWTVVTRVVWVTGSIITIGGIVIVSYLNEHPTAFANLISKFFGG